MKNTVNLLRFLAVILVLTLVARGTSAATLPKVSVSAPQAAEITETVSGTATVASSRETGVTAPEGLTVQEVLVSAGQKVEAGAYSNEIRMVNLRN